MTRISFALPRCVLVLGAALLLLTSVGWSADDKDQSDIDKRLDASAKVLNEIMATPDKAIPDKVMSDAKCVAVIPSMVKVAVVFGGNHGKGVATCRTARLLPVRAWLLDPRDSLPYMGRSHRGMAVGTNQFNR